MQKRKRIIYKGTAAIYAIISALLISMLGISYAWFSGSISGGSQSLRLGNIVLFAAPSYNNAYTAPGYTYLPGDELVDFSAMSVSDPTRVKPLFNADIHFETDITCVLRVSVTYHTGASATEVTAGVLPPDCIVPLENALPPVLVKMDGRFYSAAADGTYYWYYKGAAAGDTETPLIAGTYDFARVFSKVVLNGPNITRATGNICITITISARQYGADVNWTNYTLSLSLEG